LRSDGRLLKKEKARKRDDKKTLRRVRKEEIQNLMGDETVQEIAGKNIEKINRPWTCHSSSARVWSAWS
jgi:hypothetical protein